MKIISLDFVINSASFKKGKTLGFSRRNQILNHLLFYMIDKEKNI